jgi:hypothetical protein
VPAVLVDYAEVTGTRPNIVTGNKIFTIESSDSFVASAAASIATG